MTAAAGGAGEDGVLVASRDGLGPFYRDAIAVDPLAGLPRRERPEFHADRMMRGRYQLAFAGHGGREVPSMT